MMPNNKRLEDGGVLIDFSDTAVGPNNDTVAETLGE
jgi:hypothetical protein